MSSETFTRLFKECDPPAPSIMEGFLLCNGDETLAIVEPTGDTIAVLEAHRNVLHKETWNIPLCERLTGRLGYNICYLNVIINN